jgi:hypothetical protein
MAIEGLHPIIMSDNDAVTITIVALRHRNDTVENSIDRVIGTCLEIDACMTVPTAVIMIGTNHFGPWERIAAIFHVEVHGSGRTA